MSRRRGVSERRLVYGGHIISLARALSFNGLENAFHVAAINAGRHVSPAFAGDTVYAWSEVIGKARLDRPDVGRAAAKARRGERQARRWFPAQDRGISTTLPCCSISIYGCFSTLVFRGGLPP